MLRSSAWERSSRRCRSRRSWRTSSCRMPRTCSPRSSELSGRAAVATEVILPRLGQGMESGTIVRWLKSEGEPVEKGEPLFELDTDKVTQEVEAEANGVLLKIAVAEGEVPVGQTVAFIGETARTCPRSRLTQRQVPGPRLPPRARPRSKVGYLIPDGSAPQQRTDQGFAARAAARARARNRPCHAAWHRPGGPHRRRGRRARRSRRRRRAK